MGAVGALADGELVTIQTIYGLRLRRDAGDSFKRMDAAYSKANAGAHLQGYEWGAYRDAKLQHDMHLHPTKYNVEKGVTVNDHPLGTHETGTAIDIIGAKNPDTISGRWLRQHASEFGWILGSIAGDGNHLQYAPTRDQAANTTPITQEEDVSYSLVPDNASAAVFLVSQVTGRRVGLASAYHLGLMQRLKVNNANDKMTTGELDLCQGYLTTVNAVVVPSQQPILDGLTALMKAVDAIHVDAPTNGVGATPINTQPILDAIAKLTPIVDNIPQATVDALGSALIAK